MKIKVVVEKSNIANILKLDALDFEERQSIIEEMVSIITERVFLRITKELTDQEIEKLNIILENNNLEEFDRIMSEKIPDFMYFVEKEVSKMEEEIKKT